MTTNLTPLTFTRSFLGPRGESAEVEYRDPSGWRIGLCWSERHTTTVKNLDSGTTRYLVTGWVNPTIALAEAGYRIADTKGDRLVATPVWDRDAEGRPGRVFFYALDRPRAFNDGGRGACVHVMVSWGRAGDTGVFAADPAGRFLEFGGFWGGDGWIPPAKALDLAGFIPVGEHATDEPGTPPPSRDIGTTGWGE